MQTAERISSHDNSDNVIYQRHLVAYENAKPYIKGDVLEIGSGEGYGFTMLAKFANSFICVDKFAPSYNIEEYSNAEFKEMTIPPLLFEDNTFDAIVSFQVIEHIEDDNAFVSEIERVLKPGGIAVISTPNIKMSLTRNPWHIREYTVQELKDLFLKKFDDVTIKGVFGNKKINDYYLENKKSVEKITRFDVLKLQYRLPRWMLQVPYDVLNRVNRRKLLKGNTGLVQDIKWTDYSIEIANDTCFDLFAVVKKK